MEKIPPLSEFIAAFRRHFMKFSAIIFLGMIGSVIYALTQPRSYQTSAVVQIVQSHIQDSRAQGTTSGATLQRLQVVEQKLMARDNLIKIIKNFDLYPGLSVSEQVLNLRLSVNIERIQDQELRWRSDIAPTALMIEVTDGDAQMAAKVANEFVDSLLAQSRESSAQKAREALVFFESEKTRVGDEIAILDIKVSEFKQKNAAVLPEGLTSLRTELVTLNASVLQLESKIVVLKSEIANVANSPSANKLHRLEEQFSLLDSKRKKIVAKLAQGPEVEREFIALKRKHQLLTDQYNIINKSRSQAEMEQMLEVSRQSSNFEILETALVPQYPFAPNRKKIAMTGVVFSAVIAIMLIAVLEFFNASIRTTSQLSRRLNLTPVVSIPTLQAPKDSVVARIIGFLKARGLKKRN